MSNLKDINKATLANEGFSSSGGFAITAKATRPVGKTGVRYIVEFLRPDGSEHTETERFRESFLDKLEAEAIADLIEKETAAAKGFPVSCRVQLSREADQGRGERIPCPSTRKGERKMKTKNTNAEPTFLRVIASHEGIETFAVGTIFEAYRATKKYFFIGEPVRSGEMVERRVCREILEAVYPMPAGIRFEMFSPEKAVEKAFAEVLPTVTQKAKHPAYEAKVKAAEEAAKENGLPQYGEAIRPKWLTDALVNEGRLERADHFELLTDRQYAGLLEDLLEFDRQPKNACRDLYVHFDPSDYRNGKDQWEDAEDREYIEFVNERLKQTAEELEEAEETIKSLQEEGNGMESVRAWFEEARRNESLGIPLPSLWELERVLYPPLETKDLEIR